MERRLYMEAVNRYSDMVLRLCLVYVKNIHDANDCCQNVFLKLYKSGGNFENEEHIKAWLIKVCKNECRDLFKSYWRKNIDLGKEAEGGYEEKDSGGEAVKALLAMNGKYRDILYLHYYEGYKIHEISKMLELKENTVKTRLSRGRKLLEKALEGGEEYAG